MGHPEGRRRTEAAVAEPRWARAPTLSKGLHPASPSPACHLSSGPHLGEDFSGDVGDGQRIASLDVCDQKDGGEEVESF